MDKHCDNLFLISFSRSVRILILYLDPQTQLFYSIFHSKKTKGLGLGTQLSQKTMLLQNVQQKPIPRSVHVNWTEQIVRLQKLECETKNILYNCAVYKSEIKYHILLPIKNNGIFYKHSQEHYFVAMFSFQNPVLLKLPEWRSLAPWKLILS